MSVVPVHPAFKKIILFYTSVSLLLCGRRWGWDDLREQHWNMYIIKCETEVLPAQVGCMRQVLRAGALGRPRGMRWGGRWKRGSGWRTHANPWLIHVNVWRKPLQYFKVISLQLIKINEEKNDFGRDASWNIPWLRFCKNHYNIVK